MHRKIQYAPRKCAQCGNEFIPTNNAQRFCNVLCRPEYPKHESAISRLVKTGESLDKVDFFESHADCYLKEAHAMLKGKNTAGKNRCVKLEGDI